MIGFVLTFVSTMILVMAIPVTTSSHGNRKWLYDALTLFDNYENNNIQSLNGQGLSLTPYFIGYDLVDKPHIETRIGGRRSRKSDVDDLGLNQLDDTYGTIILLKRRDKYKPANTVGAGNYFY